MIERGDRIALVGVNGRAIHSDQLLSQTEPLSDGEYKLGQTFRRITSRRISTRSSIRMPASLTISARSLRAPRKLNCAAFWAAFCFPRMMF